MLMMALMPMLAQAQEAPPIVGGSATDDHLQVGMLALVYGQYWYGDFCSGTLIKAKWVATAAHCIEAADEYERKGYDIYFVTGEDWDNIYDYAKVSDIIAHPQYNPNTLEHDIGLLELQSGMATSGTYPINRDSPGSFSNNAEVVYVGWGITGDNRNDSGTKRTVTIDVYGYDDQVIYTYDPTGETNICSGDSGGAALMRDGNSYELVGVNSFTFNLNGGQPYCEASGAAAGSIRLDAHTSWVEGYTGALSDDTDDGGDNGGGNNGGGNNGGGDDTDTDDDTDDSTDTGSEDTGSPGGNSGGNNGGNNNANDGEIFACSSTSSQPVGLLALALMGAALLRRRD